MPVSGFNRLNGIARRVKKVLRHPKETLWHELRDPKNALKRRSIRIKKHAFKQVRDEIKAKRREDYQRLIDKISKIEDELKGKRREVDRIAEVLLVAEDPAQRSEHKERKKRIEQEIVQLRTELRETKRAARAENIGRKKSKKRAQQEIFQLERELGAARSEETGALPDFVVIGERKCGTTFLYHLLSQHPLVEPCAKKELHFFDVLFDEGLEWYRQCFPVPTLKDGHRTITGEATPYMSHRLAPERMAKVLPEARLMALLRDPVDRAYSDYQQVMRKGRETRTFEEAIRAAEKARSSSREGEERSALDRLGYLSRSIYVDKLLRWSEFFPKEQMLVLKSEDLFERPHETLKTAFEFLGLPDWEPEASEIIPRKRNKGEYEQEMDPATRRRLEEYFEPHNQRLYDYLGVNLGW